MAECQAAYTRVVETAVAAAAAARRPPTDPDDGSGSGEPAPAAEPIPAEGAPGPTPATAGAPVPRVPSPEESACLLRLTEAQTRLQDVVQARIASTLRLEAASAATAVTLTREREAMSKLYTAQEVVARLQKEEAGQVGAGREAQPPVSLTGSFMHEWRQLSRVAVANWKQFDEYFRLVLRCAQQSEVLAAYFAGVGWEWEALGEGGGWARLHSVVSLVPSRARPMSQPSSLLHMNVAPLHSCVTLRGAAQVCPS